MSGYDLDSDVASKDLTQANTGGGGGKGRDARLFRPKPFKDGQTFTSQLFVPLVKPRALPGFENYPLDHYLFYIKLFGHFVESTVDDKKSTDFVLCTRGHNKYVREIAKNDNIKFFDETKCAHCEQADVLWGQWNDRWAELGYPDKAAKGKLSKEDYKQVSSDAALTALKNAAVSFTVKDRYAVPVYDLDQQPLAAGIQWFMAPETVFKGLMTLVAANLKFYSLEPHPHVPGAIAGSKILLTVDATEGLRYKKYTVVDDRQPLALDANEIEFLKNQANFPALLELVTIWTYDQQLQVVMGGATDTVPEDDASAPVVSTRTAGGRAPVTLPAAATTTITQPAAPLPSRTVPAGATTTPPAAARTAPAPSRSAAAPVPTRAPTPPVAAATGNAAPKPRRTW